MTAGVADGERRGIGVNERIGMMVLLRGAFRRARSQILPLAALWLAIAVGEQVIAQFGPRPAAGSSDLTLIGAVKGVLNIVLSGLGAAVGLRILLQGPGRWRQLDRPLLECAALMGAMGMAFLIPSWAYGLLGRFGVKADPAASGLVLVGLMAVGFYITVKLVLWPIGRLMNRPDVTAGRSWRLTRKATRGYVLAHALLFLPIVVAFGGVYAARGTGAPDAPLVDAAMGFVTAVFAVLSMAIDATLYQLRVENPATVADVFD